VAYLHRPPIFARKVVVFLGTLRANYSPVVRSIDVIEKLRIGVGDKQVEPLVKPRGKAEAWRHIGVVRARESAVLSISRINQLTW
jgi:hypothetical protein